MQFVLPERALPAKLTLNPELRMNDDDYYEFCMANANVRFERTAQGEIIIVPPAAPESDYQSLEVAGQLREWARRDRSGKAFGSSVAFILPEGAALSPDAAWISNARISQLPKEQLRKIPRVCPEFVVEVMSASDRLRAAQDKMGHWIRGGAELGWLIHGDDQTIYIYRSGRNESEKRTGITKHSGEGPAAGFELDLTDIWAGL